MGQRRAKVEAGSRVRETALSERLRAVTAIRTERLKTLTRVPGRPTAAGALGLGLTTTYFSQL